MPTGLQTKLELNDGASNAFVEIFDSMDVDVPDEVIGRVKTGTLSSAANRRMKNSLGMIEDGKFTFKQVYGDDNTRFARLQLVKNTNCSFRVTFPSGRRATIPVEVFQVKLDALSPESEMMINVDAEQRGNITWDNAT